MDSASVFLQVGKCLITLVTGVFRMGDSFEENILVDCSSVFIQVRKFLSAHVAGIILMI